MPVIVRTVLSGAIDYAGLFPPAGLDMASAVGNYLAYRSGSDAWALGRFVVPVARLDELEKILPPVDRESGAPVRLAALPGPALVDDIDRIEAFNRRRSQHGAQIESLEVKAISLAAARKALDSIPPRWTRYVEVPIVEGNEAILDAVRAGAGFAKLRTGGVTKDAFPGSEPLLRTLIELARLRLPFKATAGLHHPLRGPYPLTDEPGAPRAVMYGYLNLLLASGILWFGGDPDLAREVLLESDPASLCFDDRALLWRGQRFEADTLGAVRAAFFHGFGSCAFREPLDLLLQAGAR